MGNACATSQGNDLLLVWALTVGSIKHIIFLHISDIYLKSIGNNCTKQHGVLTRRGFHILKRDFVKFSCFFTRLRNREGYMFRVYVGMYIGTP